MVKVAFALIITSRHQRLYFLGTFDYGWSYQPLKAILQCPHISGRLIKWVVELSAFNISYQPQSSPKAQALADFIMEAM